MVVVNGVVVAVVGVRGLCTIILHACRNEISSDAKSKAELGSNMAFDIRLVPKFPLIRFL